MFLLKQADIDNILKIIQRKVLKEQTYSNCKRNTGRIFNQPIFFETYIYILYEINCLPLNQQYKRGKTLAEKYMLLLFLLFKLVTMPKKETTLLAIPEICANKIITLYHPFLFA